MVVGAHAVFEPGWIPTERESLDVRNPADWKNAFGHRRLRAILAEHVWEHLTPDDGLLAASMCREYLVTGGHLRIAVPDGLHPSDEYREWVDVGGSGPAAWDHKVLYDYRSLSELLRRAGFEIRLLEYWDERGEFNHVDWDPADGLVHRSRRFHKPKRALPFRYTSLIVDAVSA